MTSSLRKAVRVPAIRSHRLCEIVVVWRTTALLTIAKEDSHFRQNMCVLDMLALLPSTPPMLSPSHLYKTTPGTHCSARLPCRLTSQPLTPDSSPAAPAPPWRSHHNSKSCES